MRSENHPVGFRKFILLSAFGCRLRLHVWPDGGGSDSRHNHRWWFVSLPLLGKFKEMRYCESPGQSYLKIDVLDADGVRDTERIYRAGDRSSLTVVGEHIRRPLIPYFCPVGAIHSLVPIGEGRHASLVLVGPIRRNSSDIWRKPDEVDVDLSD
jgi:hypothetical protein